MNAETSHSSLSFWCSNPFSSSTAPLDAALFLYLGSSLSVSLKNGPKNVSIVGAQIHRNDRNSFFAFYSFSWRNDGRKKMQRSFSSIYLSFLLALTQFLATLHTNWQIEYWSDAAFSFGTLLWSSKKYCWWIDLLSKIFIVQKGCGWLKVII